MTESNFDLALLDQVVLAASTLFDARRQPLALRLTVGPLRPDAVVDPASVLALVDELAPPTAGPIVLDVADERAVCALASTELAPNVWLEIPGFLVTDDELAARLADRVAAGNRLVLRGRVPDGAPQGRWALFRHAVVDRANIRTPLPAGAGGQPPLRIYAGSDGPPMTLAALRAGFDAVQGWPVGDPPGRDSR
ncbi:MAG TPA: hypothetical protein VH328_01385, partial [Burkholderiaceae bacterium]|nr:hypothetical protein [Burkholderiaceae bacterium]